MTETPLKIIFMGTPEFAVPSLEAIAGSHHEIVLVVTQPDRRKGRGLKVSPPPIKVRALDSGLNVIQPHSIKDRGFIDSIKEIEPDLIVVVAFGQILTSGLLAVPRMGTVNVHPSLLPCLRGAAPIQRAILEGASTTGVTTMLMNGRLDAGDILLVKEVAIAADETGGGLHDTLAVEGGSLLVRTISRLAEGTVQPVLQDESRATYAHRLTKEEGRVHWSEPASVIHNRIRGLDPWPGAFTTLNGRRLMLYGSTHTNSTVQGKPGEFIDVDNRGLQIATSKGSVFVREVKLQGRKRLDAASFLRGNPIHRGMVFQSE